MNVFSLIGLFRQIYGSDLPDLDKIQKKGLLAVKIAQHFALRIDFLDQRVCRHLAKLFQATTPVSDENVKKLLKDATDDAFWDQVKDFEEKPLASASIGQVHSAKLASGQEVVVKFLKSDFQKAFLKDIARLKAVLRITTFFRPSLKRVFDPEGILRYIEQYTLSELDLRNEFYGQQVLRQIYEQNKDRYNLSMLDFHTIHEDLTNSKVMVAQKLEAASFDALLNEGTLDYQMLLELFNIHGFYLFGPGVFHGDIHPGNIFLRDGKIVFIDTGAISAIGTRIKNGLFTFFVHLAQFDYQGCADAMHAMSQKKLTKEKFAQFKKKFLELYKDFGDVTVSEVSLTKKMMDSIKMAVVSGMQFERGMFAIIKGLMYMDGMVLRCNPQAKLIGDMARFISDLEPLIKNGPYANAMDASSYRGVFSSQ